VVILLDLFNTLVPGGDADRDAVSRAMAGDLGVDPDDFIALVVRTWRERVTGELGDLPTTVRWLAGRLGGQPSEDGLARAVARRLELTRNLLRPSAGTVAALEGLRAQGYRLGLVSNCTVETPAAWGRTPFAGLLDAAAFSCSVGVGKPDPRIYLAACTSLGVAPAGCVYLGDGADGELPAAAALGMRAIQTVEYKDSDPSWAGERIRSLDALAGLLTTRRSAPAP
jgi:putative hydrolase of the HAD superfamily